MPEKFPVNAEFLFSNFFRCLFVLLLALTMRAFIKAIPGKVPEYIMVELQGDLTIPNDPENQVCLFLYWHDENSPVCLIGHQMIRGKMVKLEKPLLVVDTKTSSSRVDENTGEMIGECKVVMVIRRRLLFKDRPKPILF